MRFDVQTAINFNKCEVKGDKGLNCLRNRLRQYQEDGRSATSSLPNKKMTLILAQGDTYLEGSPAHAYDLRTPYLRFIFGIIGITDIEFIYTNSLNVGDEARNLAITKAQAALKAAIAH